MLFRDEHGDGVDLPNEVRVSELAEPYPASNPPDPHDGDHLGHTDAHLGLEDTHFDAPGLDRLLTSSTRRANGDAGAASSGLATAGVRWTTNRPSKAALWAFIDARATPPATGAGPGVREAATLDRNQVRKMTGVPPRDLRVMDPTLNYPSSIMIRERALVVNLEHVKAIITADFMLLQQLDSHAVTAFLDKTRRRLLASDGHAASAPVGDDDAVHALRAAQPRKEKGAAASVASLATSRAAEFLARSGAVSAATVGRRQVRNSDHKPPAFTASAATPRSQTPPLLGVIPAPLAAPPAGADAPTAPPPVTAAGGASARGDAGGQTLKPPLTGKIPMVLSMGNLPTLSLGGARGGHLGSAHGSAHGGRGGASAHGGHGDGGLPAELRTRGGGGGGGGRDDDDGGREDHLHASLARLRPVAEDGLAFELRALECCLQEVVDKLCNDVDQLARVSLPIFDRLTRGVNKALLETARRFKTQLARMENKVENVHDALEKLLDSEAELADLCLTRKREHALMLAANGVPSAGNSFSHGLNSIARDRRRSHDDGGLATFMGSPTLGARRDSKLAMPPGIERDALEDVENCIEAYFEQIDGAAKKLDELREYISNAEDYVAIELDSHRNQLIQLELLLTIATLCVSCYALVGSLFGMNARFMLTLDGDEPGPFIFRTIAITGFVGCAGLFVIIVLWCRRMRLLFVN
ncbi:hypothetical protein KFE25_002425 [Diacronema lutheri]|uniref:Magnesium transporter n=3 Tax=Diacronema lutheri TaxID=2081491 RepID=A0A8J5X9C5_DIALT|nr:hypothetical protein KFE25_002425 [Diacronema lutheri]